MSAKPWKCLNCGAAFYREMAEKIARSSGIPVQRQLQVCQACKVLHKVDDDGNLQRLTMAEIFEANMLFGQTLAAGHVALDAAGGVGVAVGGRDPGQ